MFGWSELGYDILWKLFKRYKFFRRYDYYHYDFEQFAPIIWNKWNLFFEEDIDPKDIINNDTIAIMLYNKYMFEPLKELNREEILESNTLLGKLFKFSLSC